MKSSAESPAKRAKSSGWSRYCQLFRWLCVLGLSGNLGLLLIPTNWKPYVIRRYWSDYRTLIELKTTEKGFGAYGLVWGHHATLYQDGNARNLDPIRKDSVIERAKPGTPSIDSRWLMWNGWGPSCSNTPAGVGMAKVGEYFCVPYSFMAVAFAIPLAWWALGRLLRRTSVQ